MRPAGPAVHVAVVSWNTREHLERCLDSLAPDARSGLVAVTVVDNASSDGSAEMVRARHGWARLIEGQENLGYGRAANRALSGGPDTPWVAPANADLVFESGAIAALLAAGERDPGAGAFAPRLVLDDGSTQHSVHPFPRVGPLLAYNLGLHRALPRLGDALALPGAWDPERERRVPWAVGAFLLVRREAWRELGGFDERLWLYAEDLDLGWRLARAGRPTRYVPAARVRHHSGASARQAFDDASDRWQAESYAWMRRALGPRHTRAVAAINLAGTAFRWVAGAPPGRATWRRWARLHARGAWVRD